MSAAPLPDLNAKPGIRVIAARELTPGDVAAWSHLQTSDPLLASPFFRPEFTQAVAGVRDDARVAIVEDAAGAVAFFPFQVGESGIGHPIGGPLSDYHGVIARAGWSCDARNLIRGCGLSAWEFDHLPASQQAFAKFQRILTESPIIDLSQGYASYVEERVKMLSEPRKKRKLEREVGPVRFETHCADRELLQLLMSWKAKQYVESGKVDIFTIPWVVAALEQVYAAQGADFAGLLSVLYAADEPIAIHMGMRSRTVWHYWFPTYNPAFASYSPGMLLLLEMAAAAASLGVKVIDLGKGRALYKERLHNSVVPLIEGSVPVAAMSAALAQIRSCARALLHKSPLLVPARKLHVACQNLGNRLPFLHRMRSRRRFQ